MEIYPPPPKYKSHLELDMLENEMVDLDLKMEW